MDKGKKQYITQVKEIKKGIFQTIRCQAFGKSGEMKYDPYKSHN